MNKLKVLFETERLKVVPFVEADHTVLSDLHNEPQVNHHLTPHEMLETPEQVKRQLRSYIDQHKKHGLSQWKILLADGTFIGRAGFSIFPPTAEFALSSCFRKTYLKQNYTSEIVNFMTKWFFDKTYYTHLITLVGADNHRSRGVMERHGYYERERLWLEGKAYACLQILCPALARRFPSVARLS